MRRSSRPPLAALLLALLALRCGGDAEPVASTAALDGGGDSQQTTSGTRDCGGGSGVVEPDEGSPCDTPGVMCTDIWGSLSCSERATCTAERTWRITCPATWFGTAMPCTCPHPGSELPVACAACEFARFMCSSPGVQGAELFTDDQDVDGCHGTLAGVPFTLGCSSHEICFRATCTSYVLTARS